LTFEVEDLRASSGISPEEDTAQRGIEDEAIKEKASRRPRRKVVRLDEARKALLFSGWGR